MPLYRLLAAALLAAIHIASPLFSAPLSYNTRKEIPIIGSVITVADFNKDGRPDLITAGPNLASSTADYQISIQYGTGGDAFQQGPTIDLGPGFFPTAIATGDFNSDGLLDLVVLAPGAQAIYIVAQLPGGTFQILPVQIAEGTTNATNILVTDLNGDGFPEIVIPSDAGPVILMNLGGASFAAPKLATSIAASAVYAADVNGDKKQDLIILDNICCSTPVIVLLGDGIGGFDAPLTQPAFSSAGSIAIADFNQDGKLDLVATTGGYPGDISVAFGNGDGTFGTPTSMTLSAGVGALVAADLNADGLPDIAVIANNTEAAVAVFINAGKGSFTPPVLYPIQANPTLLTLGAFHGGRYPDLLVTAQYDTLAALLVNGKTGLQDGTVIGSEPPSSIVAADFNGDGKTDLAGISPTLSLTVYVNSGSGLNPFTALTTLPFYGDALGVGDFNQDGRMDMVILSDNGSPSGQTLLGNGAGSFTVVGGSFSTGTASPSILVADMNNDGKPDLITNGNVVNLGNGDGTFQPPINNLYCSPASTAIADFNGDGNLDSVSVCDSALYLYLGTGGGYLGGPADPVPNDFFSNVQVAEVGDFNGDGIPDIVFASTELNEYYLPTSMNIVILIGQGDGTFAEGNTINAKIGSATTMIARDFNNDGHLDVMVVDTENSAFAVIEGNGDGTFRTPQLFGSATTPTCAASSNFTGKRGFADFAFCSGGGISLALSGAR